MYVAFDIDLVNKIYSFGFVFEKSIASQPRKKQFSYALFRHVVENVKLDENDFLVLYSQHCDWTHMENQYINDSN